MVSDRRNFGERMKRQRERSGVTLATISALTKVPVALFVGLEAGDCSRWPAGLYARSYVRGYAEAIGVNANDVVEEFTILFAGPVKMDGIDIAVAQSPRAPGALRLGLVEESPFSAEHVTRRAGLAATELVIGALIAAIVHVGLGAGAWITAAALLAYFVIGRLVSDEPLLYWMFLRARTPAPQPAAEPQNSDVPVATTASTTA